MGRINATWGGPAQKKIISAQNTAKYLRLKSTTKTDVIIVGRFEKGGKNRLYGNGGKKEKYEQITGDSNRKEEQVCISIAGRKDASLSDEDRRSSSASVL